MRKPLLLLFLLFFISALPAQEINKKEKKSTNSKILILTHAYNRPDFIEMQQRTLDAFLQEDYELIIFNDAVPGKMHDAIKEMCAKLNIQCIPIPQEIHAHLYPLSLPRERFYTIPSARHTDCIQYSLELIGFNYDGIVGIMDSDLFFIQPFSAAEALENHEIAAIMSPFFNVSNQCAALVNAHYIWPGLVFMKMKELPNRKTFDFSPGVYPDFIVDTGGHTFFYLKANPTVRVNTLDYFCNGLNQDYLTIENRLSKAVKTKKLFEYGYTTPQIKWLLKRDPHITVEFGCNNRILHYRGASYEDDKNHSIFDSNYIDAKTKWVKSHINEIAPPKNKSLKDS